MKTRIVLIDDHGVVRDGLRSLLNAEPDLEVVGETGDPQKALDLVQRLRPDVMVVDLVFPVGSGVEVAQRALEIRPELRVLFLTMHLSPAQISRALEAGARGYLLKESAGQEVIEAIRAVFSGRRYLSPRVLECLLASRLPGGGKVNQDPVERLSAREREVLFQVVEGRTSLAIARALSLSPKTVETYRSRIMQKLGVTSVAGLVKLAIRRGLIPLDEE